MGDSGIRAGVELLRLEDSVVDSSGSARDMSSTTSLTCYLLSPQGVSFQVTATWVDTPVEGVSEAFFANTLYAGGVWSWVTDYEGVQSGERHRLHVADPRPGPPAP